MLVVNSVRFLIVSGCNLAVMVKVAIYRVGFGFADMCGKCICFGSTYGLDGFEGLEQRFFSLWANAFYFIELTVQGVFGPLVTVEGYGVAVNFVLYACESVEQLALDVNADSADGVAVHQFVGTVAIVLGKASYGNT